MTKFDVRKAALVALERIEKEGAYTDLVLPAILDKYHISGRDARLLNEIVRGTVRMKLRLDWLLSHFIKKKIPQPLQWILWIALYQIEYLDRVPDFAAVNSAVNLARTQLGAPWPGVANGILRSYLRERDRIKSPPFEKSPVDAITIETSHPAWLVKKLIKQIGADETLEFCRSNNSSPGISLRLNLPALAQQFESALKETNTGYREQALPNYYLLENLAMQIRRDWLERGIVTVQDASAGLVAHLVDPQPDELILDLCAAPGGKSRHMNELSQGKSRIVAADIAPARVQLMKKGFSDSPNANLHAIVADAARIPVSQADKVLLDAPCSGLGVLRKKTDIRWRRSPDDIIELSELQVRLLTSAAAVVRPGGLLVYSTCTVLQEENETIIDKFLSQNPDFGLEKIPNTKIFRPYIHENYYIRTWPHRHKMDGSFAAMLRKSG